VREAQILDKRIDVFIKVAERRLLALTDPNAANNKQVQKDLEKWGELPKGTRTELLTDLAKILEEAITNIDDVAARDAENRLLPKALRKLAAASTRFAGQLTPMREQAKDEAERDVLEQSLEEIQSILEAANKLPPDVKEKDKGKKSDKGKS
jgi:acyl-CoA reductase-like NAD-dependent aldehyde dehydrogenase